MPFIGEKHLRSRADEFIGILCDAGVTAKFDRVLDYALKLGITEDDVKCGKLVIYYKATKGTFSISTRELNDEPLADEITALWENTYSPFSGGCDSKMTNNGGTFIFVDGSCIGGGIGYGAVVVRDSEAVAEISGCVADPVFTVSRQVGGEITAVTKALEWCIHNGVDNVVICYDLENLRKWVTGEFNANLDMTRIYRDFVRNCGVAVTWKKIEAHTGVKWNEIADKLAKKGASF